MGKSIVAPGWALKQEVVGYTASQCIDPSLTAAWMQAAKTRDPRQIDKYFLDHDRLVDACRKTFQTSELPSVYYKQGHATLQHEEPGWEGGRIWLFFQNVSKEDWGYFGDTQRAKDIQTALKTITKANPNLKWDQVFTKYVAQHLQGPLGPAITKRVGPKLSEGLTGRLILAEVLLRKYGTCCIEASWNLAAAGSSTVPSGGGLLEMYDEGGAVCTHKSRNGFYPTQDSKLTAVLHCLAISPAMWVANPHIQPNHKKPPSGKKTELANKEL